MFEWFKKKKKANPWICVDEWHGGSRYVEDLVRYPDDEREVDFAVVNGNVSHGMTGYYKDGEWWTDDYSPEQGEFVRKMKRGVTVAAWRELITTV